MAKRLLLVLLVLFLGFSLVFYTPKESLSFDPSISRDSFASQEVIVRFKPLAPQFLREKIIQDRGAKIKEKLLLPHTFVLRVPAGEEIKIAQLLSQNPLVSYAEPNYLVYAQMVPNDPYYRYQWHLDNSSYGGIQMEEAWDISSGSGVTVAVVDTGIRKGSDLENTCFLQGYDYVENDSDPTDDNGHGTHVAGTLAQSTNNSLGVAGVAFSSCLMPVKVLDSQGSGTYAWVANGIYYAVDHGAKVINLSLGGSFSDNTLKEAVKYAYEKGVTVVAACGNENKSTCLYPASYDDYVIAVGATQYDEKKAPYSNYGPSLDLVAPGGNLNVDQNKDGYGDGILQQTFEIKNGEVKWGYYFFQGTSMATPHVSGVAALLISAGKANSPDQVRTILQSTAEDKGTPGKDDIYGWGLVDAASALGITPTPTFTPTPTPTLVPTATPTPTPTLETTLTPTPTPRVEPTPTPTSSPSTICWSGSNRYLYRQASQAQKFCKCAQGTYGYKAYTYSLGRTNVYYYTDSGDNENWNVAVRTSNLPIISVRCADGLNYSTNKDYFWPK